MRERERERKKYIFPFHCKWFLFEFEITIPRTTPNQDHFKVVKPLVRTNIYMVGNCPDTFKLITLIVIYKLFSMSSHLHNKNVEIQSTLLKSNLLGLKK